MFCLVVNRGRMVLWYFSTRIYECFKWNQFYGEIRMVYMYSV